MIEGFGSRLTMLRAAKGMTIAQLAGQLHISSSVISRYESDERLPSFSGLIKLAHFFGVSTDYLLGMEPLPDSEPSAASIDVSRLTVAQIEAIQKIVKECEQLKDL